MNIATTTVKFDPMAVQYDPESTVMPTLTKSQYNRLASDLNDMHSLFYMFWHLGKIRFTDSTPVKTAAICFNKDGDSVDFIFHPEFWNSIDEYTRKFVICHECLHVVLKHGIRMRDTLNPMAINIALDIVVNHTLVNKFGFDRSKINGWSKFAWVDTVFAGLNLPDDKYAEYYIGQIKDRSIQTSAQTVDDHGAMGDSMDGDSKDGKDGKGKDGKSGKNNSTQGDGEDKGDKLLKRIDGLLSGEEKRDLKDFLSKNTCAKGKGQDKGDDDKDAGDGTDTHGTPWGAAGKGRGGLIWTFPDDSVKAKVKWQKLVRKWTNRNRHVFADSEQWSRISRRNVLLPPGLFIPSDMETYDADEKQKIKAWFFLDTSGSCLSFRERFWKAAESVPRRFFTLKLHTFDTSVYPIDEKRHELRGGGGTSFYCIEQYIQQELKANGGKYPEIVVIITDGCGDSVDPLKPKSWNWIMPQGSPENYCHDDSPRWNLEEFEE